ncbi:MAG: hypothetical protein HYS27_25525 [Deltaproteobacteria bacterium]|nr:hypothetical protein [Deltaproteobacteria bacterium]
MTRTLPLLALVLTLLSTACCATGGELVNGSYHDAKVSYRLAEPGEGWRRLDLAAANVAWFNDALAASLMTNSHCEGVKDAPLTGLTEDLLIGLTDRVVVSQQTRPCSRREALETIVSGKLDGVDRKLALLVLKKDGCVYDIVLGAGPEHFDAALVAFARVRDGFDVDARARR